MSAKATRPKIFVSFHQSDVEYKDRFVEMLNGHAVDRSVGTGDIIDSNLPLDEIRRRIRDDYIADANVTVVLIGPCTWQRKHVDWEISSSLRQTRNNPRCGLLGIRLPHHTDFRHVDYNPCLIPPRLADNCEGPDQYAQIHRWSGSPNQAASVCRWIDRALERSRRGNPVNNRRQFGDNRRGDCTLGWRD